MIKKRLWREPFLHFVILGVLLFVADAWLRDRSDAAGSGEIVVTAGRIENLASVFAKTWQRPPTASELESLVNEYVLEEALFREGVALGVDQGDAIIRRRVRQKVEFFVDDLVSSDEPAKGELETWLADHPESYRVPAVFTFRQVFLNPERHGDALSATVEDVLEQLRSADPGLNPALLGDASLLEPAYAEFRADMVVRSFGQGFADQLATVPTGEWSGPLDSEYGVHLVYVDSVTPERLPTLTDVRDQVERDWRRAEREAAAKLFYDRTLERYDVTVEWSEFLNEISEDSE